MLLFHWGLERRRSSRSDFDSPPESIGCSRMHWQLFMRAITRLIRTPLKFQNMLHLPCVLSASGTPLGWCWLKTCDWCISQLLYDLTVNTLRFLLNFPWNVQSLSGFWSVIKHFPLLHFWGSLTNHHVKIRGDTAMIHADRWLSFSHAGFKS